MVTQQQGQFRVGKYLGNEGDEHDVRYFQYELVKDKAKTYSHLIQNLITAEGSTIIKTNYNLDWMNQRQVILQDKCKYIITNIQAIEDDVNPQVFGMVLNSLDTLYYIELVEMI